jgi:hypothetical protein
MAGDEAIVTVLIAGIETTQHEYPVIPPEDQMHFRYEFEFDHLAG